MIPVDNERAGASLASVPSLHTTHAAAHSAAASDQLARVGGSTGVALSASARVVSEMRRVHQLQPDAVLAVDPPRGPSFQDYLRRGVGGAVVGGGPVVAAGFGVGYLVPVVGQIVAGAAVGGSILAACTSWFTTWSAHRGDVRVLTVVTEATRAADAPALERALDLIDAKLGSWWTTRGGAAQLRLLRARVQSAHDHLVASKEVSVAGALHAAQREWAEVAHGCDSLSLLTFQGITREDLVEGAISRHTRHLASDLTTIGCEVLREEGNDVVLGRKIEHETHGTGAIVTWGRTFLSDIAAAQSLTVLSSEVLASILGDPRQPLQHYIVDMERRRQAAVAELGVARMTSLVYRAHLEAFEQAHQRQNLTLALEGERAGFEGLDARTLASKLQAARAVERRADEKRSHLLGLRRDHRRAVSAALETQIFRELRAVAAAPVGDVLRTTATLLPLAPQSIRLQIHNVRAAARLREIMRRLDEGGGISCAEALERVHQVQRDMRQAASGRICPIADELIADHLTAIGLRQAFAPKWQALGRMTEADQAKEVAANDLLGEIIEEEGHLCPTNIRSRNWLLNLKDQVRVAVSDLGADRHAQTLQRLTTVPGGA